MFSEQKKMESTTNKKTLVNFFALCDHLKITGKAKDLLLDAAFCNLTSDRQCEKTLSLLKESLPAKCFVELE